MSSGLASGSSLRKQRRKIIKTYPDPVSLMEPKIAQSYVTNKQERDHHIDQMEAKRSRVTNLKREKTGLYSSGEPGQSLTPQNDASIRGPEIDAEVKQLKSEIPQHKKRALELNKQMRNVEQLYKNEMPEESRQAKTSLMGMHSFRKSPGDKLRSLRGGKKRRTNKKRR